MCQYVKATVLIPSRRRLGAMPRPPFLLISTGLLSNVSQQLTVWSFGTTFPHGRHGACQMT